MARVCLHTDHSLTSYCCFKYFSRTSSKSDCLNNFVVMICSHNSSVMKDHYFSYIKLAGNNRSNIDERHRNSCAVHYPLILGIWEPAVHSKHHNYYYITNFAAASQFWLASLHRIKHFPLDSTKSGTCIDTFLWHLLKNAFDNIHLLSLPIDTFDWGFSVLESLAPSV